MLKVVHHGFVGIENNNIVNCLVDAYFDNNLPPRDVGDRIFYRFNSLVLPMIDSTYRDKKNRWASFNIENDHWVVLTEEVNFKDLIGYKGYLLQIAHDDDMYDGERPYYRLYLAE